MYFLTCARLCGLVHLPRILTFSFSERIAAIGDFLSDAGVYEHRKEDAATIEHGLDWPSQ